MLSSIKESLKKIKVDSAATASLSGGELALKTAAVWAEGSPVPQGKKEYKGYCHMCMAVGSCSNIVTVENGVVTNIEGDPERTTNRSTLCARGKGAIMNMYNPYRIKAPMKRTNPKKGMNEDPGWVEISWEEAIQIAGQKLKEVHDRDPRELVHFYGFAAYECSHGTFGHGHWAKSVFGTPNASSCKGQQCAVHYGGALTMTAFPTVNYDAAHVKYIVALGKGLGLDIGGANGDARGAAYAWENGLHSVVIGPYCNIEAGKGEWIPSRPGTDLSIIYALLHTILYELNRFDIDFVKRRTNAPYLINGQGEYARGSSGKPQIWDAASESMKDFDDISLQDPALEGSFAWQGEKVRPAFTLFKESLKNFTPEWASGISAIPADTLRRIATELVDYAQIGSTINIDGQVMPYRPSSVILGRGVSNHVDGTLIDCFSRVLNMLLGNIGYPGGITSTGSALYKRNADGVVEPISEATTATSFHWPPQYLDLYDFFPHRHSTNALMLRVICDPQAWGFDYKPTVLFSSAANPVTCCGDPDIAIEALTKFDYIIYHACYHMDEMAMMSDLLLPEGAALEEDSLHLFPGIEATFTTGEKDFYTKHRGIIWKNGVGRLYNTMNGNDVLIKILKEAGLLPALNDWVNKNGCVGIPNPSSPKFKDPRYQLDVNKEYTIMEMWDLNLKSSGLGIDLNYLKEHRFFPTHGMKSNADLYPSHRDKETRFPIYLMSQKHSGDFLIAEIQKAGVDTKKYVGVSLDELRRRYTAVPYYPDDSLRPIFNHPPEYDMSSFTFRMPMFLYRMGSMDQNPITRDWSSKYHPEFNTVLINAETARKKGINEGDLIVVESQFGKTQGRAYLTQRCHPETIGIGGTLGRKTRWLGKDLVNDTSYNDIWGAPIGYVDPIDGAVEFTIAVKVYKASALPGKKSASR
ncbi:molybdopterin-dependent oxidoreductase [Sporomusa termitida]|uniref:Nitrate reductase n=1 Tax=Sporomusa termitida TaxID=2377 RepID=A0A517E1L7_9FIRM|nr:molybdopterin-dependent oxidoreductase [Sporomusa termitida]QDR83488.1 Nitrate reductase [Sporomusa termitida]